MESEGKCPVCAATATNRCSGCKQVSYCCKDHQKSHWKQHKNSCIAYEVRTSERLGRYLVAARDLQPGDVVITETPLIWAPKAMYDPERVAPCVGCYAPVNLDIGERCSSCGWPICSGLCKGLKDPRHHGIECLVLSLRPGCAVANLGDYYRHDALMVLRCLLSQKKFQKKYKKIIDLQSHIDERGPKTETYQEVDTQIVKYLQDNFLHALRSVETELKTNLVPDISDKLLHSISGIIDVNSLDLILNNGVELSALYHTSSIMEHNCSPNTKHSFDILSTDEGSQYKVIVRAALPIKKGENITTMYSHALWGTQARREHLKETKYFSCVCERCKDPTELGTNLSSMICIGTEKSPCGGIQLPVDPCDDDSEWLCNKCPMTLKSTEAKFLVSKLGEEVENAQMRHPSIGDLEELIKKLTTFLHPHHYHVYSAKHSLLQLYGHQYGYLHEEMALDMLDRKLEMCNELLDITKKLDFGNARLGLYTGVLCHETYQVKFEKQRRQFKAKNFERAEFCKELEATLSHLKDAQNALRDENEGSAGYKLLCVIKESENKFIQWTKSNGITIK